MRIMYKCSSQTPATYLCNRYIVATNLNSDAELYSIELLTINIQKPKLFLYPPPPQIYSTTTSYLSLRPKPACRPAPPKFIHLPFLLSLLTIYHITYTHPSILIYAKTNHCLRPHTCSK